MKKTIITLIVLVMMSFSALAIINGMTADKSHKLGDKSKYEIGVKLEKGWNLIVDGTPDLMQNRIYAVDSDIRSDNIKAIYGYNTKAKEYVKVYPDGESAKIQVWAASYGQSENTFSTAFWVYSDKAGYLRYAPDEYILDLNQRELFAGWNFVGITPEFKGRQLKEMKGHCNIEKAYAYNNKNYAGHDSPSWEVVRDITNFEGAEGTGMIVKVSAACKLGSAASTTAPPTLPN